MMRPYSLLHLSLTLTLCPYATLGAQVDPAQFEALHYRSVGPTQGGRVTTVTGVSAIPGTFYFGATGGGVWKSEDYGQSWHNISDGFLATGSIGAIAVAPSDPHRLYVGTGSDGLRSNVIVGKGVYRSDDAGSTWRSIGLPRAGQIGAVLVHPTDPDQIYVAAIGQPFGPNSERGVFRSRDGGTTWDRVLFLSDSTGAVDLEFAPDNPQEIYASLWRGERKPWTIISGAHEGGVYRSRDGGSSWTKLGGGLPTGLIGKSDLAVSAAAPNRLYVLIEAASGGGLYRSDDRGETFTLVSTQRGILDRPFYYTNVDATPTNADEVFVEATRFWQSTDGGKTFRRRSTPHGDNHDLWIDPNNPNVWIQSNDGGANVTRDGGETWSSQDNQPTAELYQVAVDDRFPYWLYAGQQDNGTAIAVPSLPPGPGPNGLSSYWHEVGGCETGPAVPKPGDPDIIYANCKGRFSRLNLRTGQEKSYYVGAMNLYGANPRDLPYRFQRVVPIHVSPHDPNTVYHASQYLHRSRDEGVTWEQISPDLTAATPETQVISGAPITRDITGEEYYSTIYSVRESSVEAGVIWVGANDGPISVTRDNGRTWHRVTPPTLPPGGRVQTVEPSPHRAGKAYAAILRNQLDDWQPYLYRTADYGTTWTRLSSPGAGIPADVPVRVVREDPAREGLLYAGTEFGMYVSFDDGAHWQSLQLDLPVTPVTDLALAGQDLVISTMGRGFWILDDVTPLRKAVAATRTLPILLPPSPAIRMRYRSRNGEGAQGEPEFPPPGALIDYLLPKEFSGTLALEIVQDDRVLRRFISDSAPTLKSSGTKRLETTPGHHRIQWDLTLPGAWDSNPRQAYRGGPLVVPGLYQVRLLVDGTVRATQPLRVQLDPRVTADGVTQAHVEEQLRVSLSVVGLLSASRRLLAHAEAAQKELGDAENGRQLSGAIAQLETADQIYPTPMLVDQIGYLSRMINGADQKLGRDAITRFGALQRWYEEVRRAVEAVAGPVPR